MTPSDEARFIDSILLWTLALGWTGTGWLAALLYTLWTWEPC